MFRNSDKSLQTIDIRTHWHVLILKSFQLFLIHWVWMLVESRSDISTSWLCNREGLSSTSWTNLPALPGPRFIGCNSAWADGTCGFPKAAEALYDGSVRHGFKRIFHDLRSSVVWQFDAFSAQGFWISHRYELCALPSFLLSILMPFTSPFSPDHIFAPLGDALGPCLRKEEPEELEAGSNCRSGEWRSRAQGLKALRSDLWWRKEPAQSGVKQSATLTH